jgi:hypothetical protein
MTVVGGIVPYLYRHMPQFRNPGWESLRTLDVDLTLPRSLKTAGLGSPAELLRQAGIARVDGRTADGPGSAYYQSSHYDESKRAPVYLEFLTSKMGQGSEQFRTIAGDIRAQTLRYIDLVQIEPLVLDLQTVPEADVAHEVLVQVPQPALFILPKPLIRKYRAPDKRPKDMAYVYDVVLLSRKEWSTARRVLHGEAFRSGERNVWRRRALLKLDELFRDSSAAGAVEASLEMTARGQSIAPRAIAETVQDWLDAVWPPQWSPGLDTDSRAGRR